MLESHVMYITLFSSSDISGTTIDLKLKLCVYVLYGMTEMPKLIIRAVERLISLIALIV